MVYVRSTVGKAQDVVRQMVSSPLFNVLQLESVVIHRLQRKFTSQLVSSPDLIQHVYRFQYTTHNTESDPRWDWFWVWDRDYISVKVV